MPSKTAPSKKRKPRRKKGRYKTGIHKSPKCLNEMKYRSGWELVVAIYLDEDDKVDSYAYEPIAIEYISNVRSGKVRRYYPDFLVNYKDGTRILVEVKRLNQLNNLIVQKKAKAAEEWCKKQNQKTEYQFWTDQIVKSLKKIQDARAISTSVQKMPAKITRKIASPRRPTSKKSQKAKEPG
jgi:hypothetical protein